MDLKNLNRGRFGCCGKVQYLMADFGCGYNDIDSGIDIEIDNGTAIQENKLDHHVSVCHAFLYYLQ